VIKFNNLELQWHTIKNNVRPQIEKLFETSAFINGPAVGEFEKDFAEFVGCQYAVGVSNGTDAIKLSVEALELQGKVGIIIPANTFIATILGAEQALPNAEFVLVDCDEYYQIDVKKIEESLEKNRSKWDECLIIPVHLYGHCADMAQIMSLAVEYDCKVMEDASQSRGTICEFGLRTGNIGRLAAFSLYPGKNLGAAGDAGIITTNDPDIYERLKLLKNWGSKKKYFYELKGYNNRLDTIQAIILNEKLKYLHRWNRERNLIAADYNFNIKNPNIIKPQKADYCVFHTYHVYCIRTKNSIGLMKHLNDNNIQTNIHYPVPIELTKPYAHLEFNNPRTREYATQLISLPIHPFMSPGEVNYICEKINSWEA